MTLTSERTKKRLAQRSSTLDSRRANIALPPRRVKLRPFVRFHARNVFGGVKPGGHHSL